MTSYPKKVTYLLLTGTLLLLGCDLTDDNGSGSVSRTDRTAEASFTYTIATQNRSSFRIEAINGAIEIAGVPNTDTVIIEGVRIVGSETTEDAEDYLSELEVEVNETSSELQVETIQPNDTGGRRLIVEYEITLPNDWQTTISQVNGTVTVEGMRAELEADLVNGDIQLSDIIASTNLSVVNGSIDSQTALPENGTLNYGVVNGQVSLQIPDTTSAEFSARVVNGDISLSGLSLSNPDINSRSVTGTLGDGEGLIELETTNGNIDVVGN